MRKMMLQQKTIAHPWGYYILVWFILFKILLPNRKLDWILNPSSFLQYLATILQINISNFSPTLLWNPPN